VTNPKINSTGECFTLITKSNQRTNFYKGLFYVGDKNRNHQFCFRLKPELMKEVLLIQASNKSEVIEMVFFHPKIHCHLIEIHNSRLKIGVSQTLHNFFCGEKIGKPI